MRRRAASAAEAESTRNPLCAGFRRLQASTAELLYRASRPSRYVILVTGGLGYIGSHTCIALAAAGHALVIVDNLSNAKPVVFQRMRELAPKAKLAFNEADIRDAAALDRILASNSIDAVVHFAGLKAVGESVEKPLLYYDNNVGGTVRLLQALAK